MATPTSSSNRAKRNTNKPVTTDKGRNNRAKVSTAKPTSSDSRATNSGAKVTNAGQRTSSGSAKVSGTQPAALPAKTSATDLQRLKTASKTKPSSPAPRAMPKAKGKPALPAGNKGGALVPSGTRRTRAEAKATSAAQGTTGPNRVGRSDARPALPQGRSGGPIVKADKGGAMTRAASGAAKNSGGLRGALGAIGRASLPIQAGMLGADLASQAGYARGGKNYREFTRAQDKAPTKPVNKDANGRGSRGINTPSGRTVATGSQQYNNYHNQQIAAERERLKGVGNPPPKPKPPAPKPPATGSSGNQSSRPGSPASPKKPAAPASPKDRRVSSSTSNRESGNYGTSRTNNPMIDDAMKARMRQREEREGVGPVKDGARYSADVKNSTKGVGPVKDGERYTGNLKPSNKDKSNKGMTLAERLRKRRQNMA